MKKLICISLLLLYSCSSTSIREDKNAPINDYLETQNLDNQKIMIIKEKINNNVTIAIFEGKTYYYEESNKYVRVEGVQEPLYNKELWEKMKFQYENKSTSDYWIKDSKWTRNDFRYKNIYFFKKEKLPKPWEYDKSISKFREEYTIFTFSEPIYYDKKYAVFTKIRTSTYSRTFGGRGIVIMEKVNDKWVTIKEIGDGIY